MSELSNFQKVKVFYQTFGLKDEPDVPTIPDEDTLFLRFKLIAEEFEELKDELIEFQPDLTAAVSKNIDLNKVAKEAADLLYVVYGLFSAMGIDADKVYAEVHRANMSKLTKEGKVLRREDGKVLKSDQYVPANIEKVLNG